MKIISSSPYATFNSREWDSLISKNYKFVNTPIKLPKKYFRSLSYKKIEKSKNSQKRNGMHRQMQIIFA